MSVRNIYQRVLAVIEEGKAVDKNGQMTSGASFSFHRVDDVLSHLRPFLAKNGIHFSYTVLQCDDLLREYEKTYKGQTDKKIERTTIKHVECRLTNVHDPSDQIVGVEVGYGIDPQDKGPGKATSYAVKTWLLNVFSLRGQPDENTVRSRDGQISPEQVKEIRDMIAYAFTDEEAVNRYVGIESLENMKLSSFGIVRRDLQKKIDLAESKRQERTDAQQSVAPKETKTF